MLWYNWDSGGERMLRTYHIFTYGFTAIEENIIGKMLPDKKSVLVSADCFTDLVACNSYAILIHAASVADEDFKMLWNYYLKVGTNALEEIALFDTKNGYEVDEITEQMIGQIAQYMNEDAVTPAGWWVSWCYPNGKFQDGYYDNVPDFKHMNPCAVSLVDKQNRMEFVKSAVKNFEQHILKHLKNLPYSKSSMILTEKQRGSIQYNFPLYNS